MDQEFSKYKQVLNADNDNPFDDEQCKKIIEFAAVLAEVITNKIINKK